MTISVGFSRPLGPTSPTENFSSRTTKASFVSALSGKVLTSLSPVCISNVKYDRKSIGAATKMMLTTGRRMTAWVMMSQNPPLAVSASFNANLPRKGMVRSFTRGPRNERAAGSRVSVEASAASTTRMAPSASDWWNDAGTISSPTSASTTVAPLKSTVRPAVSPARSTAARGDRPRANSSLNRDTISSE